MSKKQSKKSQEKYDVAEWFRGTSTFQNTAADSLQNALRDDVEQNTTHRVRAILQALGLQPPIKSKLLRSIMKMSKCNDLAFLYGIMVVFYKKKGTIGYSLNEQIIMSTIAHLDMITTLRELDRIIPPGHISKKKQEILDKIKAKQEAALKKAMRPKKERVPAILPYFEKLVRPVFRKRRLSCKMPDVVTTSIPYDKYLDPHYKIPNSNRWFSSYSMRPSERIVRAIIDEEIDKIFCDLECASARANGMEIICEYHFQEYLNQLRKKNERIAKMREMFGGPDSYVPNFIARRKRRQYIIDRLHHDIKANIDHLRKRQKNKIFKVKVLSGKSEVCDKIVEVGTNEPFFKIMDKDFPPFSPVESYADMPGHYLRPCPCSGKKCKEKEKYIAPDCHCHEGRDLGKKDEKKPFEGLPKCKPIRKKKKKSEMGRRRFKVPVIPPFCEDEPKKDHVRKAGGEDLLETILNKTLPTKQTRTPFNNTPNNKTPAFGSIRRSGGNEVQPKSILRNRNSVEKSHGRHFSCTAYQSVRKLEDQGKINDILLNRVKYEPDIRQKKPFVGTLRDTPIGIGLSRKFVGGERLKRILAFKEPDSMKTSDSFNESKQIKETEVPTEVGRSGSKFCERELIKQCGRQFGGEDKLKCIPYHQPGTNIISQPCKRLCTKGVVDKFYRRFVDMDDDGTDTDFTPLVGEEMGSVKSRDSRDTLNDEVTPTQSKVFFKAATEHTPHAIDYNRVFRFSSTSINTKVKKMFVKALDPTHVVPPEWEGHPNVIGAAAYNFHKLFKAGVQQKTKEIEEAEKEDKGESDIPPTHPDYALVRMRKKYPQTYFDADDKQLMDNILADAMKLMRKNPYFVLASFPDSHKLPILREWIYRRYGKVYTKEDRVRYLKDANLTFQELNRKNMNVKFPAGSEIKAPPNMTYKQRDRLMQKFYKLEQEVMNKMDDLIMETSRDFWFGLHPFILPKGPPRNTYYAYMPARVQDIQHFRLWQPGDYKDYKRLRLSKQREKEAESQPQS